jgi:multidrug efflux pump subunit AcrB
MRGGTTVISKRVGTVVVDFADGQDRATAHGQAASYIDRAEATLPEEIRDRLSRKRRAGDADAAIDPLAQPEVRSAIAKATFEQLVGFQLTEQQLAYNATR